MPPAALQTAYDEVNMPPRAILQDIRAGSLEVRLACSEQEVEEAKRLRYRVFVEEMGAAPTPQGEVLRQDFDEFDRYCDHLLVLEHAAGAPQVVGTYRLLRRSAMAALGRFYTEDEFDIATLQRLPGEILELGRSCVDQDYRNRAVMQLLWRGITAYVLHYDIQVMFGCGSLHGSDPAQHSMALSYLHHYHLAPPELRPAALPGRYVSMNLLRKEEVDVKAAFSVLPALIKGYLRLGGYVGDGAVVDEVYNTTDVSVVVKTALVTEKYVQRYAGGKTE